MVIHHIASKLRQNLLMETEWMGAPNTHDLGIPNDLRNPKKTMCYTICYTIVSCGIPNAMQSFTQRVCSCGSTLKITWPHFLIPQLPVLLVVWTFF